MNIGDKFTIAKELVADWYDQPEVIVGDPQKTGVFTFQVASNAIVKVGTIAKFVGMDGCHELWDLCHRKQKKLKNVRLRNWRQKKNVLIPLTS